MNQSDLRELEHSQDIGLAVSAKMAEELCKIANSLVGIDSNLVRLEEAVLDAARFPSQAEGC